MNDLSTEKTARVCRFDRKTIVFFVVILDRNTDHDKFYGIFYCS